MKAFESVAPIWSLEISKYLLTKSAATLAGQELISAGNICGDHPPQANERPPTANSRPGYASAGCESHGLRKSGVPPWYGIFWLCSGKANGPASRTRIRRLCVGSANNK